MAQLPAPSPVTVLKEEEMNIMTAVEFAEMVAASRTNAQSADTPLRLIGYSPMVLSPVLRLVPKPRRTLSGKKSMKPTSPSRFSLLARNGSDGERLCTICGKLTEPADIWADRTYTCSKACSEVKRYNLSILEKGIFAGKPYRSQAHA